MKNLITILIMLLVGCATTPTMKSVAGTYEFKDEDGHTERAVLLETGIAHGYYNGTKSEEEAKWKISKDGELHAEDSRGVFAFIINKNGSITGPLHI